MNKSVAQTNNHYFPSDFEFQRIYEEISILQ